MRYLNKIQHICYTCAIKILLNQHNYTVLIETSVEYGHNTYVGITLKKDFSYIMSSV